MEARRLRFQRRSRIRSNQKLKYRKKLLQRKLRNSRGIVMAMMDTIKGWSWYGQAALFAIIAAILLYIGHSYLIEPINGRMAKLSVERDSLIQEINKGETLKARSIEFEAESKRLESQLESLKRILPESEEIADL